MEVEVKVSLLAPFSIFCYQEKVEGRKKPEGNLLLLIINNKPILS
jgi:hypothetical protein